MRIIQTAIPDVLIVESPVFGDERGFFNEVFHANKFSELGLPTVFLQDNHSRSAQHSLRGLHYQLYEPQGKLVRPVTGTIFDVAVDMRRSSPTFGRAVGETLRAGDGRQLWVPPGFAHGFLVLSESADVSYKCTTVYHPSSERSLAWNCASLAIHWPIPEGAQPKLSPKDAAAVSFGDAETYP